MAVFFGCVIAIAVAYVATYSRFHPQPTTIAAATSVPALASAAIALTTDLNLTPLPAAGGPLSWARLTPEQRAALAPFAGQWDSFSDTRKRKWLRIAARFQKLPADEQKRLQERWTQWAKMTPEQRSDARENYQLAKQLPAQARERAWKAYQQLPEEQKERLAAIERHRRPTVVSAPPTGKHHLAPHELQASAAAALQPALPAAASGAAAAQPPAPAAAAASAPPAPAAQPPLPGTSSMFTGS
ncbi:DUF3106 domain-containing protein [Burkholderia guangdongensis]|uniref:DUF3106 domain-containing protein n=1 Tax=Burkholderia guangdongensis TaxID=1792500 RepID=UPI0015C924F3|nr:DUF3106 domain-containing protein [Burkholderia guangdongensis]